MEIQEKFFLFIIGVLFIFMLSLFIDISYLWFIWLIFFIILIDEPVLEEEQKEKEEKRLEEVRKLIREHR